MHWALNTASPTKASGLKASLDMAVTTFLSANAQGMVGDMSATEIQAMMEAAIASAQWDQVKALESARDAAKASGMKGGRLAELRKQFSGAIAVACAIADSLPSVPLMATISGRIVDAPGPGETGTTISVTVQVAAS